MPAYAWLTPPAPAALGVVVVDCAAGPVRRWPEPGTVALVHLRDAGGGLVDEALCLRRDEDHAELHVHGGPGMRTAVEAALAGHGYAVTVPPADPRWETLAAAPSPAAATALLRGVTLPSGFDRRQPLILITGPANAGKSTLVNACCGHARCLVSDLPGTTRDLVAAEVLHRGWRLTVVDSAGLRPSEDPLERAGQGLVAAARARADLVVHLHPADDAGPYRARAGDLLVLGKSDLCGERVPVGVLTWSDRSGDVAEARSILLDAVLTRLGLVGIAT